MFIFSALLLFLVGVMHSALGGPHLVHPLANRHDLPVILGSRKNSRLTLLIGWHALTLVWWGQAAVLLVLAKDPALAVPAFLMSVSVVSALLGVAAICLSRGRHMSWVFFLPLAVCTAYMAF